MSKDDDWKQQAIMQDVAFFARSARKRGYRVIVEHGNAPRADTPEDWERIAPTIQPEQILPWFMKVLFEFGKKDLFTLVIRLKEYRLDLAQTIDSSIKQLGLTKDAQRAEMRFLNQVWKTVVLPRLTPELMPALAAAAHAKGTAIVSVYIERLRRHKRELLPIFLDALAALEAGKVSEER